MSRYIPILATALVFVLLGAIQQIRVDPEVPLHYTTCLAWVGFKTDTVHIGWTKSINGNCPAFNSNPEHADEWPSSLQKTRAVPPCAEQWFITTWDDVRVPVLDWNPDAPECNRRNADNGEEEQG